MALAMFFQACTPSLEIDPSSVQSSGEITQKTSEAVAVNFTSEAGTASFSFDTNKKWTAEAVNDRASDWLHFSPSSGGKGGGTINISVSANSSYEERAGVIELKCGDVSRSVRVTQKQNDAVILSSSRVEISSDGDIFQIEVKHNVPYSVQIEEGASGWIRQTTSGTKGLTSDVIKFEVKQNFDIVKREGKILVSSSAGSEIVTVYQAGETPAIILSDNEEAISDKGGLVSIAVTSNVDVEFSVSDTWVHAVETKTMSTDTYQFSIDANPGYDPRHAEILFTNKEHSLKEKVIISQMQKDAIVVVKTRYDMSNDGGGINIEVGHNVPYYIELDVEWIHQEQTKAFENDNLYFVVSPNETYDNREGVITFANEDKTIVQKVKVYQTQTDAIIISQKEFTVSDSGGTIDIELQSNVDFTVSPSADWLRQVETKSLSAKTLHITIDANEEYESREAGITIRNIESGLEETVVVTQMQKDAIVLSKARYDIDNEGGNLDVVVGHNIDYDVSINVAWISIADTKSFVEETLHFTVSPNESYDNREGIITFSSKDGKIVQKLKVYQSQKNALIISSHDFAISDKGGAVDIEVKSNVNYDVIDPSVDWLHRVESKSLTTSTIRYYADANDTYDQRSAEVVVRNVANGIVEKVVVTQMQKDAIVIAKNEYHVSDSMDILDIEVNHNVDFDVAISVNWIDLFMTKAMSTSVYSFWIDSNMGSYSSPTTDRIGKIVFSSHDKSVSQEVSVIQDGSMPIFEVGNTEFTVPAEGGSFEVPVTHSREISVDITDADWLHLVETKAIDANTLCFSADESNVYGERVGHAVIKCGGSSTTLTFTQEPGTAETISLITESEELDFLSNSSTELAFFSPSDWTITVRDSDYFTVSESSGKMGEQNVTVTALHGNSGNGIRSTVLTIAAGDKTLEVPISQIQAFEVNPTEYHISGEGSSIKYTFEFHRSDYSNVHVDYDDAYYKMVTQNDMPSNTMAVFDSSSMDAYSSHLQLSHTIYPNYGAETRSGKLRLTYEENGETFESIWITVIQEPGEFSHDYSDDGLTYSLQNHKRGNKGVPVVIMGDGFMDTDVASGKYDEAMALAYKNLFAVEPMASLKDLFDVYVVTAVSPSRDFTGATRFESKFGEGTRITGNDSRAIEYAMKASDNIRKNDLLVLVILNSTKYAGTASMVTTSSQKDIPDGYSVAYIPMSNGSPSDGMGFGQVLHHEAIGHGFAKLGDEYAYSYKGAIPSSELNSLLDWQSYGCFRNVDIHPNVEDTYWSSLAANPQFSEEHLGAYEGAYTYWMGVYRPTETSIMVGNIGGFNAPSREMIYKRAMKIAFGDSWEYNEDDFLEFDASCMESRSFGTYSPGSGAGAKVGSRVLAPKADFIPLAPPIIKVE